MPTTEKHPKETYRETYRKGAATIKKSLLPDRFPFTSEGWAVDSIEVMAAGVLEDGREFQEVRIITREAPPDNDPPEIEGRAGSPHETWED